MSLALYRARHPRPLQSDHQRNKQASEDAFFLCAIGIVALLVFSVIVGLAISAGRLL